MRKTVFALLSAVFMMSLGASVASAQIQVTLLGSSQNAVFASSGGPGSPVSVTLGTCGVSTCVISDSAVFQNGGSTTGGTFTITETFGVTPIQLGTPSGGVFPVNMNGASIAFAFSSGAGNLNGTINLLSLKDQPMFPQFVGTLTVTSTSGSLFASLWPTGETVGVNLVFNLGSGLSVTDVFNHTGGTTTAGPLFNGGIPPVPEPGSMLLLGTGLLTVGATLKRRLRS